MTSSAPKWPQVAERIAERIRSGDLAVGDRLPAQHALAAAEGVSLKVLQKALTWLAAVGAVERVDNVGVFIREVPADPLPPMPAARSLEDRVAALEARLDEHERGHRP